MHASVMYAGFPVLALNSRLTFTWPQILKHSQRKRRHRKVWNFFRADQTSAGSGLKVDDNHAGLLIVACTCWLGQTWSPVAWRSPDESVGPPARWAATSNVGVRQMKSIVITLSSANTVAVCPL